MINISKKIVVWWFLILSWLVYFSQANAIKVAVTQDLSAIGLPCSAVSKEIQWQTKISWYECEIGTWFWAVTGIFQWLLKYVTFIAALWAVLFIVVNGILYSMAGLDEHLKSDAKQKIWMMLGGIILLLLSWVVLNIIAPWVYK
jgi:hypothetical protein